MAMGETEARIRRLASRLKQAEYRAGVAQDQIMRTRQGIAGFFQVGAGSGPPTTLNGRIIGGLEITQTPMPDTALRVEGATTLTDYGTYSVPTGIYSLAISGVDPTDTTLNLYPAGPVSPRFTGATPLAYPKAITVNSVNAISPVIPPAAPGYAYLFEATAGTAACLYPVGSLDWSDTKFGTGSSTLNFAGPYGFGPSSQWESPCFTTNSYATIGPGACSAQATTPVAMLLTSNAASNILFKAISPGVNNCPAPGGCTGTLGQILPLAGGFITSMTAPSFDLTTKFDYTWFGTNQLFHNSASRTVRWYEP